jgi:hypothetical protein
MVVLWLALLVTTSSVPVIVRATRAAPDLELVTRNQELLDRTLAIVGGQPITLSDARVVLALGLIEPEGAADPIPGATRQLVDRELVLREVQRYAPAAPAESAVEARLEEIRKRFGGAVGLTRMVDAHGFGEQRLKAWIRDDLRTQAYLAQRFASASTPTDQEISLAYAGAKAEFDGKAMSFEQAAPVIRDRLIASRRRELIADWVSDLRRRTDVVILRQ